MIPSFGQSADTPNRSRSEGIEQFVCKGNDKSQKTYINSYQFGKICFPNWGNMLSMLKRYAFRIEKHIFSIC